VCVAFQGPTGGQPFGQCAAPGSMFCCGTNADCPVRDGAPEPTSCVPVSSLSGGSSVCLPDRDYCGAIDAERLVACHTTILGRATPLWAEGDCDKDGLANGDEIALATDPCVRPPPLGYVDAGQCRLITSGCTPDTACDVDGSGAATGTCVPAEDHSGTRCMPPGELLFCANDFPCPSGTDDALVGGVRVCVPVSCLGDPAIEPAACVTNAQGALVPFSAGDCDGDGATNGAEQMRSSNPCGEGTIDGGSGGVDAGEQALPINFEGGGGCVCRAAPTSLGAGAPWLLALAVVLVRRRR
jgi:thrombospondin type 3 repeat protein